MSLRDPDRLQAVNRGHPRTLFALDLKAAELDPDHAMLWTFFDPKFGGTYGPPAATDGPLAVGSGCRFTARAREFTPRTLTVSGTPNVF